jgi:hypothetical protein
LNIRQNQHGKAETFAALHAGPETLVIPNPWDIGAAKILTNMGFKAPATTSVGYAFSRDHMEVLSDGMKCWPVRPESWPRPFAWRRAPACCPPWLPSTDGGNA